MRAYSGGRNEDAGLRRPNGTCKVKFDAVQRRSRCQVLLRNKLGQHSRQVGLSKASPADRANVKIRSIRGDINPAMG